MELKAIFNLIYVFNSNEDAGNDSHLMVLQVDAGALMHLYILNSMIYDVVNYIKP